MSTLDELLDGTVAFLAPEDLILGYLKPLEGVVPNLKVGTWIAEDQTFPFVKVRVENAAQASGSFGGREVRWLRRAVFTVETFTQDPDGDYAGSRLQDIVVRRMLSAFVKQEVVPGVGHMGDFVILDPPHRASDWATSTGIVQYASLPQGVHRYESAFLIAHRPDMTTSIDPLDSLQ